MVARSRRGSSSYLENIGDNPITKFFPVEDLPTSINQVEDNSPTELDEAVKTLLSQTIQCDSFSSTETAKGTAMPVSRYEAFRNVDHLNQTALDLYKAAGMINTLMALLSICDAEANIHRQKGAVVGASLETMTDAIYRVERAMVVWQTKNRNEGEH